MSETNLPKWKWAAEGTRFNEDCLMIYDHEKDTRLGRCAIKACRYVAISDILAILDRED